MSNLKEEYNNILEQRKKIIEQIKPLEENEIVKKYFELKNQNEELYNKEMELYKEIKNEEYASCHHILIYSQIEHDRLEGRTYKSCGCIKCGLDDSVLDYNRNWLSFPKKIMYDYRKGHHLGNVSMNTKIVCDLDLAQAIFSKIKEHHPDINDETAVKYFEIALDDIRKINVNEERKVSRAKRLSLDPRFNRWNGSDVSNE